MRPPPTPPCQGGGRIETPPLTKGGVSIIKKA